MLTKFCKKIISKTHSHSNVNIILQKKAYFNYPNDITILNYPNINTILPKSSSKTHAHKLISKFYQNLSSKTHTNKLISKFPQNPVQKHMHIN